MVVVMSGTPKLIPGPFLAAVARALKTAPPPKAAKDRKAANHADRGQPL